MSAEFSPAVRRTFKDTRGLLAELYLGDGAEEFIKMARLATPYAKGDIVPSVAYSSQTRRLGMKLDEEAVTEFASQLEDDHEIPHAETLKIIIGVGVSRMLLARYLLPLGLEKLTHLRDHNPTEDVLVDDSGVQQLAGNFDSKYDTSLQRTIERIGGDEIKKINVIRYSAGVCMTSVVDDQGLREAWAGAMESRLADAELSRSADLKTAMAILDPTSAWQLYDDTLDHSAVGLAMPMSISEIFTIHGE